MPQKSVQAVILIVISITAIILALALTYSPTSNVTKIAANTQGVALDEQYSQNSVQSARTIMQTAIFQPVINMLTVIGGITASLIVLSKIFTRVLNR